MKLYEATRDQYALTLQFLRCCLTVCAAGIAISLSGVASAQQVLRVDSVNGSPTGDGSAWNSNAFKSLHDALTEAVNNAADPFEICVAAGTYEATGSSGPFELLNNVEILGGFTGFESARTERKPLENITILTGPASISVVTSTNTTTTARLAASISSPTTTLCYSTDDAVRLTRSRRGSVALVSLRVGTTRAESAHHYISQSRGRGDRTA